MTDFIFGLEKESRPWGNSFTFCQVWEGEMKVLGASCAVMGAVGLILLLENHASKTLSAQKQLCGLLSRKTGSG